MNTVVRATRACISLAALKHNLKIIRSGLSERTALCAAVKANAYGHGAAQVSRVLRECGTEYLGVSSPFEGLTLRESGDTGKIILFGPTVPQEIPLTLKTGLEPMVTSQDYLRELEKTLSKHPDSGKISVHLKVDTGMGRVGCRPDEFIRLARTIAGHPQMRLAGCATHFPVADSQAPDDLRFTQKQNDQFLHLTGELRRSQIDPGILHAANSGALLLSPQTALDMARPGIALYGYGPLMRDQLKPVMELKSRITELKKMTAGTTVSYGRTWTAERDTWIATIPCGYADGYPRILSNRAQVFCGQKRRGIAGTVCMDQMMIDIGPQCDVQPGDEVILFGADPAGPGADELASLAGTIPYELLCAVSTRVPRVYSDD